MDNKEYLKRLFGDKKVKIAIIIIIISVIAMFVAIKLITDKLWITISSVILFIIMFLQFPTISNKAMQVSEELEKEAKAAKAASKPKHKKK